MKQEKGDPKIVKGTSLVVQWLRILLPMVKNPPANAGDTGSSPGPEDPTCHRATKPASHNY